MGGNRIIEPSSSMISQITPAGASPASRARSTDASVCPMRTSTPPSRARNGNVWPGRKKSLPLASGSSSARIVLARSCAEIPVVTRPAVVAIANNLHAPLSGWDNNLWRLADWYRET